jgi:hypothetical protein
VDALGWKFMFDRGGGKWLFCVQATTCSTSVLYTSSGPLQKVWSGAGGEHRYHRTKLWEMSATTMLRHRRIDALSATRAVDNMIKAQEHCSRMPAERGGGQRQRWCHTQSPRRNAGAGLEQHEEESSYSAISARGSGGWAYSSCAAAAANRATALNVAEWQREQCNT